MDSFTLTPLMLVIGTLLVASAIFLGCYSVRVFLKWKMAKEMKLHSPCGQPKKQEPE